MRTSKRSGLRILRRIIKEEALSNIDAITAFSRKAIFSSYLGDFSSKANNPEENPGQNPDFNIIAICDINSCEDGSVSGNTT